jgi:hypothetical protein
MGRVFVRRMPRSLVLGVKCAERGGDSRSYPYDAFFHVWPKQCDPKIAAKRQLGMAHGGRASRMGRAILLHLFNGRCRIVHDSASTEGMIVFVHLHLTTRASERLDVNFSVAGSYLDRIFTYITIHRVPDCAPD